MCSANALRYYFAVPERPPSSARWLRLEPNSRKNKNRTVASIINYHDQSKPVLLVT